MVVATSPLCVAYMRAFVHVYMHARIFVMHMYAVPALRIHLASLCLSLSLSRSLALSRLLSLCLSQSISFRSPSLVSLSSLSVVTPGRDANPHHGATGLFAGPLSWRRCRGEPARFEEKTTRLVLELFYLFDAVRVLVLGEVWPPQLSTCLPPNPSDS